MNEVLIEKNLFYCSVLIKDHFRFLSSGDLKTLWKSQKYTVSGCQCRMQWFPVIFQTFWCSSNYLEYFASNVQNRYFASIDSKEVGFLRNPILYPIIFSRIYKMDWITCGLNHRSYYLKINCIYISLYQL